MFLSRRPTRIRGALATLTLGLVLGCGSDFSGPVAPPPPAASDLIVTIEPKELTLAAGESRQLRGYVSTSKGIFLPGAVSWSSVDPSIALVSTTGMVTAVREGQTAIVATSLAAEGSARATITVLR
jgi:hypothetical protein